MGAIFLSYAREDRPAAERLARFLEGAGHDVWWDRRLGGGEEFSAEIEAELDKAQAVLVVWSAHSTKSRWVRDEAAAGGDTGRLVPVSIDGSAPPMGFRQFHTMDLAGWKGGKRDRRSAEILEALDRRLRAKDAPTAKPVTSEPKKLSPQGRWKPAWIAAPLLLVAIAAIALFMAFGRDKGGGGISKPTIAILPFTAASSDPSLRALANQARDSITHTFSQSGVPVQLLNAAPRGKQGIDFVINGDLSKSGDKVIASIRLDEAAQGITVFSHQFQADPQDVADLPERIGAQMAGDLTWAFPMKLLDRRHPIDPAMLADLLQGADFASDQLQNYQNSKRVAEKAPDLSAVQLDLAFNTAFVLGDIPRDERDQAVAEARQAADRALKLDPSFGDGYGTWCVLRSETLMAQCEDRLRAGKKVDPDAPFLNTFLSHLMRDVGRFDESVTLAKMSYAHDVYVPTKISWLLKTLEYSGDAGGAQDLYQQAVRWWPEFGINFFRNRMFGLIEKGDFAGIRRLEQQVGPKGVPPGYTDSASLVDAIKANSIVAAKKACPPDADGLVPTLRCMVGLASLGDQDGAYAIADHLYPRRVGRNPAETEKIWLDQPDYSPLEFVTSPGAAPMRRDPRFLALAERTGLLAYWRAGRRPDFCGATPEPVCKAIFPHG